MRVLLTVAALFVALAAPDGLAAQAQAAGNMYNVCEPHPVCERKAVQISIPNEELPTKGIVFVFGSGLSSRASFEIVDFDNRTVSAIGTNLDRQTGTVSMVSKRSVGVSDAALSGVVELADGLWNSKTPRERSRASELPEVCTDSSYQLMLFDGPRALNYRSLCPPKGVAGEIEGWIETQLKSSRRP